MIITFLGTGCMVPTKERNTAGVLITYKNENILLDCGEGTQRQLIIAGIKPTKITKILISHWHGDHVFGLPGLIQTLGASEYSGKLKIFGPKGTEKKFRNLFENLDIEITIDYDIKDISKEIFFENKEFRLEALNLNHGLPCLGFNFVQKDVRKIIMSKIKKLGIKQGPKIGKLQRGDSIKHKGKIIKSNQVSRIIQGKKITYIADTELCDNCIKLAENADILISESVYDSTHKDKAREYKHLTSRQAGLIANQAGVKKLVLTHFSQRYKNTQSIEEDARTVFDNIICAKDFMKINIT
ncbi:MAG: Ribonuclease Z [Candidatus Woesearchaeota archaeon]|nr:Ribonuclease Z [Candidatus Woesearchaeota archaeon]